MKEPFKEALCQAPGHKAPSPCRNINILKKCFEHQNANNSLFQTLSDTSHQPKKIPSHNSSQVSLFSPTFSNVLLLLFCSSLFFLTQQQSRIVLFSNFLSFSIHLLFSHLLVFFHSKMALRHTAAAILYNTSIFSFLYNFFFFIFSIAIIDGYCFYCLL